MKQKEAEILTSLSLLQKDFEGEIFADDVMRLMYATDASAYRELPLAVCYPKNKSDLKKLIRFANDHHTALIPRAAGTSLAGQVVGNGIVVDISKHFTKILEVNEKEHWVRVEPGVIRDELNLMLKPKGLYFAPETSTSNRCMMGGMLGNNACGAHALIYGSTRDHTLEVKTLLSDGTEAVFGPLNKEQFEEKCKAQNLEGNLYRKIKEILSEEETREEIRRQYPDPALRRRNNGYALDLLMDTDPFVNNEKAFNFSKLLAGSEGTLAFTTEIKLNLEPLPPEHQALLCVHLETVPDALKANLIALKMKPFSVELMDKTILELTRENIEARKNRCGTWDFEQHARRCQTGSCDRRHSSKPTTSSPVHCRI